MYYLLLVVSKCIRRIKKVTVARKTRRSSSEFGVFFVAEKEDDKKARFVSRGNT
jgi:hypothetical protein